MRNQLSIFGLKIGKFLSDEVKYEKSLKLVEKFKKNRN
jgi:hypothetical protein